MKLSKTESTIAKRNLDRILKFLTSGEVAPDGPLEFLMHVATACTLCGFNWHQRAPMRKHTEHDSNCPVFLAHELLEILKKEKK